MRSFTFKDKVEKDKAEQEGKWLNDFFTSLGSDITTGKVKDRIFQLNRDYGGMFGPEGGVAIGGAFVKGSGKLAKLVGAKKLAKSTKLIEESGGTGLKVSKEGIATWTKDGKKLTADLKGRFGSRDVGLNERALGTNPRSEDADELAAGGTDFLTKKADKDDIVSRVSEASGVSRDEMKTLGKQRRLEDIADEDLEDFSELPKFGRHAADAGGTSTEEIARTGSFYKIGKHGEPTYLSKAVDAGNLGPDDAIIHVVKGQEPKIYQGSGPASALNRFKKTRTGSEFYKFEAGAGAKPKAMNPRQILTASEVPGVEFFERNAKGKVIAASDYTSTLTDKLGKRQITFANDFDKVAYNLALSKIPNKKILTSILKQVQKTNPNITADTILQHGEKVKNRVNGNTGKGRIILPARSVQVIGPTKDPNIIKQLFGLPSEFLFSGDLNTFRQLLRSSVTHPVKTGIPSVQRGLKGLTEKGYRSSIESMPDELKLYDLIDTMDALGPAKSKELFPFGSEFRKLAKHNVYDYFGTGNAGEKVPVVGNLPRASRRMFDLSTRSSIGTETQRLADLLGMSIEDLAKKGHSELPSMVRYVNRNAGHGGMGSLESSNELLSTLLTAPRNTMASFEGLNPLNLLPESALPKFLIPEGKGKAGKGLLRGLGGRFGTNIKSPIYKDHLKGTGKMLAGYGALEGADKLFGNDEHVSLNPFDSNFGLKFGNYHQDIFGGAGGVAALLPRLLQPLLRKGAETLDENFDTDLEDTFTGINAKGDPMNFKPQEVLDKFINYRVRPGPVSMTRDAILGYNDRTGDPGSDMGTFNNVVGEDISLPYSEDSPIMSTPLAPLAELPGSKWIGDQVTPSWPSNVYDAFTGSNVPQGLASILLGGLGASGSTYDPFSQENEEYRPGYKDIMIHKRPKKKQTLGTGIR